MRQAFLRPSLNLEVINERLNTITVLLRPDNSAPLEQISKSLSRVRNMRTLTMSLHKGISSGFGKYQKVSTSVWFNIRQFVYEALNIKDTIQDLQGGERLAIRVKILSEFDSTQLSRIGRLIVDIVDFDSSQETNRTVVRSGVDEDLDSHKHTYDGIDSLLSVVANHVADSVPGALECRINVIYYPQIGFLIAIQLDEETGRGIFEGTITDPWEKMFGTETMAYYKNSNMREMDQYFGDIYSRICGTLKWLYAYTATYR